MKKQSSGIIGNLELYSYLLKVCVGSTETVRKSSFDRTETLKGGLLCASAKLMVLVGEWQSNSKSMEVG